MKAGVITFPGSNCDRDMITAIHRVTGKKPASVWHGDSSLPKLDLIVLPGGFSYGDYLRSGAISAKSPIMKEVIKAAQKGVYILGVCNGFQVLTETHLLPGTLMRNKALKFICKDVMLTISNKNTAFTKGYDVNQPITIPIAHHDGNFYADDTTLKQIEDNEQVAFQYCDTAGSIDEIANPNGSRRNIAGIFDKNKRILGMMPHPERATDATTGGTDGVALFETLQQSFA